ncbi:F-box protein At4g00755-like [Bidens hawaiensis]|uniref:F-box protein At4g00755-like n=1 Tax=Bidens hawaiensis TaxID=980011 RepID=UPI00404A5EDE
METPIDFLQRLKPTMSLKILTYLDDSADLVRASAVSRHWQNIVVSNGLSKRLCVTRYPQPASITRVVKPSHDNLEPSHDLGELEHTLFQMDFPIYPSKSVRFRMGHPKSWNNLDHDFMEAQECADDKFIWTYTSPVFPVARENRLQRFKLPDPVVCIGGFLQIELLGRVQKQAFDGKYYICVAHVQAIGRELSPAFSDEFSEPSNSVYLKYNVDYVYLNKKP